jgi:type IV pilus assembly protein PilB
MPGPSKIRLGEILVRAGLLDKAKLDSALVEQRKWGGRLGRILVDLGFVDESSLSLALARQLGLPCLELSSMALPGEATSLLDVQYCERFGVMPVGCDMNRKLLRLATSDPTNYEALEEITARTGMRIEPVIAGAIDIDRAIRRYYYGEVGTVPAAAQPHPPTAAKPQQVATPAAAPGDLAARAAHLEDLLSRQARALRALVDALGESGVLDREAYLKRLREG